MTSPAEKVCPYEGNRSSSQLRPSMVWCVCDSVGCVRFSGMSEMEGGGRFLVLSVANMEYGMGLQSNPTFLAEFDTFSSKFRLLVLFLSIFYIFG